MNEKAKQLLQNADIDKLPSLPHVLLQLLDICHNESLSYHELADILKQDAALYLRVFSVCHRDQCSSESSEDPEQKLKSLGINTIKSIAVTATVQQFFSRNDHERTRFLKQHWHHSLYCATIAESLARLSHYHNPDEAYIAGLLHDVGQLVLDVSFPDKYIPLFNQRSNDGEFCKLEQDNFQTNHQTVGAELLSRHGASTFICDAVQFHHESTESILDAHPLVKIVNLANLLSDDYFHPDDTRIFDAAEQLLGINKALLLEMLEKSAERISNFKRHFELTLLTENDDAETEKQVISNDEYKHVQLAERVRNIALLDGIHQHLSRTDGQTAVLNTIAQHTGILFGINQSILFLYDASTDRLHALAGDNQPEQLNDINLPLKTGRSLITDSVLNKTATHTFSDDNGEKTLTVIDRQLLRLGAQNGFISLPMVMNNAAVGALLLAVDEAQYRTLWKQMPLLMHFVNEIAHTISANQNSNTSTSTDTTQLTQLQEQIREIIHEVRNPLSIMNNYLGILSYKLEDDKPAQEDIETIKTEIERVGNIINRLSGERTPSDETASVDINAIIADLTHIFQTSLFAANNIQITLDLDEQIGALQSNANALKQIYTNLIKNAVEILPANGQIMVYTQDYVNVDGKEHIEISVADDGPGIDKNILPKLFSPVETTKGGDHAGLGLTIVKNLVSELHGSISCRSSEKGTSFHILLPKK